MIPEFMKVFLIGFGIGFVIGLCADLIGFAIKKSLHVFLSW